MSLNPFGATRQPSPVPTITLTGASGAKYLFTVYPLGTFFQSNPGVYAISKETAPKALSHLYIGETHDFDGRVGEHFPTHHKWAAAILAGASHICLRVVRGGKAERCRIEADLRHYYNPPLNDQ